MNVSRLTPAFLLVIAANVAAQDEWGSAAPLRVGRRNHASVTCEGKLYIFAGVTGIMTTANTMEMYDPLTDQWTDRASITTHPGIPYEAEFGWEDPGAACVGQFIYQFGGFIHVRTDSWSLAWDDNACFRYDSVSNAWITINAEGMPATFAAWATPRGTAIHVLASGGAHREFDTINETWEYRADYPQYLWFGPYFGSPRGVVTVAGGDIYGEYISDTYTWNPATLEWQAGGSLPEPRAWGVGATAKGRLYVIDGAGLPTLAYDPDTAQWIQHEPMADERYLVHGAAVMEIDGRISIHIPGGVNDETFRGMTTHLVYYPATLEAPQDPSALAPDDNWVSDAAVEFSAEIHEGHGQAVRLEVEVAPADGTFTGWPTAVSGYGPDGVARVTIAGLAEGDWKWQARARNEINEELNPGGWIGAPVVHVDRTGPSAPHALRPVDVELKSPVRTAVVEFEWSAATDACPLAPVYEVQVSNDAAFGFVVAETTAPSATAWATPLTVSPLDFFWRIRARDAAGNVGAWSIVRSFRLTLADGINHGGGDAMRNCGFGAQAGPWMLGLLALLILIRR